MRRLIIIFTFFIQSHYAVSVKWKGQDPLSVSVGGYSFFATNDNDIYKFDGTAVAKVLKTQLSKFKLSIFSSLKLVVNPSKLNFNLNRLSSVGTQSVLLLYYLEIL